MSSKCHYMYIDRLKGFAMLLVVIGHVVAFSIGQKGNPISLAISSFHMPLFIFLSGLVISTPPQFKKVMICFRRFMFPMLTVGLLFTFFIHESPSGFFLNSAKYGYWYLQVLTTFYISMMLFHLNRNNHVAFDIILALLIWAIFYICSRNASQDNDIFCLINCKLLWPYFIMGYMCNRNQILMKLICNTYTYSVTIIGTIAALYAYVAMGMSPVRYFVPVFAICACVYLFKLREQQDTVVENQLAFLGKNTLYIYIFHYFLVYSIHLEIVGRRFDTSSNVFIEFLFCLVLAFGLSYISIAIGKVIEKGKLINFAFWGNLLSKK